MSGKKTRPDYKLPGCIVLTAAVLGTRRAYHSAMEMLPHARAIEANNFDLEAQEGKTNQQPTNQQNQQ